MITAILVICIFLVLLLFSLWLFFYLTPTPLSYVLRRSFSKDTSKPPLYFDELQRTVSVYKNVSYPSKYKDNTMDIYLPKKIEKPLPVILWVHGGAYVGGDKKDVRYFAPSIAASGYAVISMNYERAPEAKYPSALLQIDEAYVFLEKSKELYSLDIERLCLAGDSAGGQLISQTAMMVHNESYGTSLPFRSSIKREHLKALLLYCSLFSIEELMNSTSSHLLRQTNRLVGWSYFDRKNWYKTPVIDETNIFKIVNEKFPPSFITDGNTFSFERQAKKFHEMLLSLGVPSESLFFDKSQGKMLHEYQFLQDTTAGQIALEETLLFLEKHFPA